MERSMPYLLLLLIIAAVNCTATGCSNSDSDPVPTAQSHVVATRDLGAYTRQAPAPLTQCLYRLSASQTGFAVFSLSRSATLGGMLANGTMEIYHAEGDLCYSDIFFPVGNGLRTVSLDAGDYLIKVQNSVKEDSSFAIYSQAMALDCTTIRSSGSFLIAGGTHEFIAVKVGDRMVDFTAALHQGRLTLFDGDFNALTSTADWIRHPLPTGSYILLADHTDSKTSGTLEISMR